MSRLRIVVTGANKGIGLGICSAYAERGDSVVGICRAGSSELAELGATVVDGVDVTDDAAVARLPERVGPEAIDVLVCNAGINTDAPGLEEIEVSELAAMYDVNALGAVRVVLALLPKMSEGSKILLMGSMGAIPLGIMATQTYGNYGYRMSKAALISFGHALANDVRGRGISVLIASPGRVDTPLVRNVLAQGRATPAILDSCIDIETAGRLFRDRLDELVVDASPAYQCDPYGKPAVDAGIRAALIELNEVQVMQCGQTTLAATGAGGV
jgi:NAD(P)-dependent dehydrogenase (short-subunit alcohol dehydrogenase family)